MLAVGSIKCGFKKKKPKGRSHTAWKKVRGSGYDVFRAFGNEKTQEERYLKEYLNYVVRQPLPNDEYIKLVEHLLNELQKLLCQSLNRLNRNEVLSIFFFLQRGWWDTVTFFVS